MVDPVQRNSKDWTSLVAVALVKQSSHFPWLQSKASFLTELQRACDTTAEWLHTVATKCIADRNAAKANRMNLTKDVTSAKTAVAAPDYQSFVEDLNLTIHSALLLLPPHSTSLSVEVVSGAQALVDEARVLKTQICTLMLLKQAEFMDNPANATASLRLKKDKLNLFVEHEIIAHTQQIAAAKNSSTVLLPSPLDDQAEVSRCPLTTSAAVMLVDALTDDGMAHKTRIEASSLADTGCLCGRQEKGISEFSHSGVDDTQGEKTFAPERAPPLLSTDACVGECNVPVMMGAQCTPKQVTSSAFPASTTTRYLTETYGNFTPDSSTPYSPLDHLEAYRVHPRILASDLRSYINRLYKDYEARVKYMNRQVELFSTWFPYPGNSTSSKKRKR